MSMPAFGKKRKRTESTDGNDPALGRSSQAATTSATLSSPFEELELEVAISLLPQDMADVRSALQANLLQGLMKFSSDLSGVVLAFSHIRFPEGHEHGQIMHDMPHIHFKILSKAQLFRPQQGHVLLGKVNKVTNTHVAVLVCGLFNASIAADELPESLVYNSEEQIWRQKKGPYRIALGSLVHLVVRRLHEASGLISIEGSMKDVAQPEPVPDHFQSDGRNGNTAVDVGPPPKAKQRKTDKDRGAALPASGAPAPPASAKAERHAGAESAAVDKQKKRRKTLA